MIHLVVTENFPPRVGGSGVLFENIYSRFEPGRVLVLTDSDGSESARASRGRLQILRRPIAMPRCGVLDPGAFLGQLELAFAIARLARRGRFLVHAGRALPEGLSALLASMMGSGRYLCWAHGEEISTFQGSRELTGLLRLVYRNAAAVLANSASTARLVRDLGVPGRRIHVVRPGVDPDRFRPENAREAGELRRSLLGDGKLLLLTLGRLQRRKGQDMTIRALRRILSHAPGARYAVVGDGPERGELERLAAIEGVSDRVVFTGAVRDEDVPLYHAACDIFVHPNRDDGGDIEGFGIVFLEAAASGRPAIGGNSGGVPEAIEDGRTGFLVDGASEREIARAIRILLASEDRRRRMGAAARERVLARFSWSRAARRVRDVAGRLSAKRNGRPARSRIRVVFSVLSLSPGGTERLVIETILRLGGRIDPVVACLDQPGSWAGELTSRGVRVVSLDRRPGFRPCLAGALARVFQEHRAEVVHCHQYSPFVYGALAARLVGGVRLVYTEHGRLGSGRASWKRILANLVLGRLPGEFFAVSEDLRKDLAREGIPADRIGVITNGIDAGSAPLPEDRSQARDRLGVGAQAFVVGTVGRLDPVKDMETLLAAFARLGRVVPGSLLVVVGGGPSAARLQERARELGIENSVRFLGERRDVRRILPAFDVFVSSSITEGISLTILEAMAAALPVVATRVGGTPEVVVPGSTGLLVPAVDFGEMAQALASLAREPARGPILGTAGRRRVEAQFSLDRMVSRYLDVYRRLARALPEVG